MGLILTEGSKKRLLQKLDELTVYVRMDQGRETIMFYAAQIMPAVVSELNYYDPDKERRYAGARFTEKPHRCEGIIDPVRTRGVLRKRK